jgi:hypothetical protein
MSSRTIKKTIVIFENLHWLSGIWRLGWESRIIFRIYPKYWVKSEWRLCSLLSTEQTSSSQLYKPVTQTPWNFSIMITSQIKMNAINFAKFSHFNSCIQLLSHNYHRWAFPNDQLLKNLVVLPIKFIFRFLSFAKLLSSN